MAASSLDYRTDSECVCKVGTLLSSPCFNKNSTTKNKFFHIKEKLDDNQQELLAWRTGFNEYNNEDTICSYHFHFYLIRFELEQNSCCDPYKKHTKPITNKRNLRKISLQKAKLYKEKSNINLVPGQLLCSNCRKLLLKDNEGKNEERSTESDEGKEIDTNFELELASRITEKEKLNESFIGINVSPLKLQSVATHSKKKYAKRKLKQAESQIKKKLSNVLKVEDVQNSEDSDTESKLKLEETKSKCDDMDKLVELMKLKLNTNISKREKIQVLTIAPQSWSRKKVAQEFQVSEYMVRKARNLTIERGILAMPDRKGGHKISDEIQEIVKQFYEDDEHSMMMPGAKDKVSIKRNESKQKRLLLCNLKELYVSFKQTIQI